MSDRIESHLSTVRKIVKAVHCMDKDTGAHMARMGHYSVLLYEKIDGDRSVRESLRLAAMLHDIGKIWIPHGILKKPGQLSSREWRVMQEHTEYGYVILRHATSPLLQLGALIARSHHEKWDGSGYPLGLRATEIPLVGRIVALVDVFDALMSPRCYKTAWPLERALEVIWQGKGKHFDPDLVDIFFTHLDDFLQAREKEDAKLLLGEERTNSIRIALERLLH